MAHGVFPSLTADAMGLINRTLPHGRGEQAQTMKGYVRRNRTVDKLTAMGQRAAREYLQPEHSGAPAT